MSRNEARAPLAAKARTNAALIPLAPPVTTTVRPFRLSYRAKGHHIRPSIDFLIGRVRRLWVGSAYLTLPSAKSMPAPRKPPGRGEIR